MNGVRKHAQLSSLPLQVFFRDVFPVTRNGKLDTKKLIASGTRIEKKPGALDSASSLSQKKNGSKRDDVATIFFETLGISAKSYQGESFWEMGGTSLSALSFLGRISNECQRDLTFKDLMDNPSLPGLQSLISEQERNSCIPSDRLKDADISVEPSCVRCSMSQVDWFLEWKEDSKSGYTNVVFRLCSRENFLSQVFRNVVARHAMMRVSRFFEVSELVFMLISKQPSVPLVQVKNDAQKRIHLNDPWNLLSEGPFWKIIGYRGVLTFVTHHIIWDETSSAIMRRDMELLSREEDPPLSLPFWKFSEEEAIEHQRNQLHETQWWKRFLDGKKGVYLPTMEKTFNCKGPMRTFGLNVSAGKVDHLRKVCKMRDMTLASCVHALIGLWCSFVTKVETVIFTGVSSLRSSKYMNTVGPFLNITYYRFQVIGSMTLREYIMTSNLDFQDALAHRSSSTRSVMHINGYMEDIPPLDVVWSASRKPFVNNSEQDPTEKYAWVPLHLCCNLFGNAPSFSFCYDENAYARKNIMFLLKSFVHLFEQFDPESIDLVEHWQNKPQFFTDTSSAM